jgi:hypothetical protein
MKLGFICLNLPGHLNPMTALARQLQGRNHEVVFLYSSSANGLPCVPGDDRDPVNENRPEVSKLQGDDALGPSSTVLKIKLLTLNDLRNVKSLLALHFWPGPHYWSSRNVGGSATPVARTACEASAVS